MYLQNFVIKLICKRTDGTIRLNNTIPYVRELTSNANVQKSKEIIKNLSPKFLQELEGLAEGLNMELDRTIKLFSGYDVVFRLISC